MIRFKGVSHSFPAASGCRVALQGIELEIERGEAVAVVGRNGSGKSSLCRCLNGLIVPERGTVAVDGLATSDPTALTEIRRRVGMVFQTPTDQLVTWRVADEIAFGPENLGWSSEAVGDAVRDGLDAWGLGPFADRHPLSLSAGQAARVALAAVLALDPAYVVFDESTSLLDWPSRKALLECVRRLKREREVAVIWATQFVEEALEFDRVVIMEAGRVVCDGSPDLVLGRADVLRSVGLEPPPVVTLSHALIRAGIPLQTVHARVTGLLEDLRRLGVGEAAAWAAPLSDPKCRSRPSDSDTLLSFTEIAVAYPGGGPVLYGVTGSLRRGVALGVVGRSGAGKTTLVMTLAGALKPDCGRIETHSRRARGGVGIACQFPEEQFCTATVAEEVALGLRGTGLDDSEIMDAVERCLASMGLDPAEFAERSPLALSDGEKKAVALAAAFAPRPHIVLLDEPTQGLDQLRTDMLLSALKTHLASGGAAAICSQSADFLFCAAEELLPLREGSASRTTDWIEAFDSGATSAELPDGQVVALARMLGCRRPTEGVESLREVIAVMAEEIALRWRAAGRSRVTAGRPPIARKRASWQEKGP